MSHTTAQDTTGADPRGVATQLRCFWYPVARARDVRSSAPLERALCGQALVLFRDADGRVRALDARCPHRGANLAMGRVDRGCVRCPYHGWVFAGDGRCVSIPSDGARVPDGYAARRFPTREQQGIVWVHLGADDPETLPAPPTFAILDDPDLRAVTVEEFVTGPFDWWVENFLNIAHITFTHRGTYGGHKPDVTSYPVTLWDDDLGFTTRVVVAHDYGLLTRIVHGRLSPFVEDITIDHHMPGCVSCDIDLGGGKRQAILFLVSPIDDTRSRVCIVALRNYLHRAPGIRAIADAVGRRFTRQVIYEDVRVAERSLSWVSARAADQLHCDADAPARAFTDLLRRWSTPDRASRSPDPTDSPRLHLAANAANGATP